jgi:hypothetical protein
MLHNQRILHRRNPPSIRHLKHRRRHMPIKPISTLPPLSPPPISIPQYSYLLKILCLRSKIPSSALFSNKSLISTADSFSCIGFAAGDALALKCELWIYRVKPPPLAPYHDLTFRNIRKENKKTNRAPIPPFLAVHHGESSESREEEFAGLV